MTDPFTYELEDLVEMLSRRAEGMKEYIHKAAARGDQEERAHYIGWLRGIEGSRSLVKHFIQQRKEQKGKT